MAAKTAWIGLGNTPFPKTRHSVGALFLDYVARQEALAWTKQRAYDYAVRPTAGLLIKPRGFMNDSGRPISIALKQLQLAPDAIVVVHDDLEREFGKVAVKEGGSAGGHNGVRSTIASLQTPAFRRLRIGIGRPAHGDVAAYVLAPFSSDELHQLETTVFPLALATLLQLQQQQQQPMPTPTAAARRAASSGSSASGGTPGKERVNR